MIKFPQDFLWGAATSAYQVEGGNSNSDWWQWEEAVGKQRSGQACRHYELYEQDFDLVKALNHNVHRLSVEWSRIEPEEGKFSESALKHYLEVILSLKARNIEPMVTLHHFTNPIWFSQAGGWENKHSGKKFLRFSNVVVRYLAKHVRFWITINEPNVYITHAYLLGVWPPQGRSILRVKKVEDNLASGHIQCYPMIKKIYKELDLDKPSIGIAQNLQAFVACKPTLINRFAAYLRNKWYNAAFLDRIFKARTMDFVGVNYYSRQLVEVKGWRLHNLAADTCQNNHHPVKKNSLGWDIYPEGLYRVLLGVKKYNLPVIITENGICTRDDSLRWEYVSSHLKSMHLAMEKGVKIIGYLYWSLLDNFEWDKGFAPRFGLIEVDYNNFKRTVRESALKFAQVCKTGSLE